MNNSRLGSRMGNAFLNVANHRETNFVFTSFLLFLFLYVLLCALFDRSLINPLTLTDLHSLPDPTDHLRYPHNLSDAASFPPNSSSSPFPFDAPLPDADPFFPLFLLLALSLASAHLLSLLCIPSFVGPLLIGVLFSNIPFLRSLIPFFRPQLSLIIRQFAFIFILIRSALGIDQLALRRFSFLCSGLGILCPLVEGVAVVLSSHFLFQIPLPESVLFCFSILPSSPAIICPLICRLRELGRGTDSGLLSAVLACTSIDNIFALFSFVLSSSIVSAPSDHLSYTLFRIPVELLVGAIFGFLLGLLLRSFPRPDSFSSHFSRTFLLLSSSFAFHFGSLSIGCNLAGPIGTLLSTGVAAMLWKFDNPRKTILEENALRLIWELFAGPMLFLLLGMLVDLSLSSSLLLSSLSLLAISLFVRLLSSLLCVFVLPSADFRDFPFGHRLFLAFSLLPKLTIQTATLLPDQPLFIHTFSIILIFAPFGQFFLRILGHFLLQSKIQQNAASTKLSLKSPQFEKKSANKGKEDKVTHSDPKDNRLRLELDAEDPADPPNPYSSSSAPINRSHLRL